MISAIAARKSAQAALQGQAETIYDVPPSPGEQPPPTASPNLPQKRKQSPFHTTKLSSTIKRRRRSGKMTGNLKSDEFRFQNDVIVIESDDDEDALPVPSDKSLDDTDIQILSGPPPHLSKDRAWLPSMPPDDSSSSDKETFNTSDLIHFPSRFLRPAVPEVGKTLSTFIPVPDSNVYHLLATDLANTAISGEKGTIVILEQGDSLSILGTCRLTLLKGAITLNGVHLKPSLIPHRIFSPRSSPLVMIEGSSGTKGVIDISSLPSRLHRHEQSKSALVFFQELPTAVEGLSRICRTFEGVYESYGRQDHSTSSPFQLSGLYMVKKPARDLIPFTIPSTWSESLSTFSQPPSWDLTSSRTNPTYLVKGPKKCGKSTFARTLLNTLLTHYARVAYLECDIGQSEFTPSGMVALNVLSNPVFGPAYTHLTLPVRSHFIGSTTPKGSPAAYLEGIRNLFEFWRIDVASAFVGDDDPDGRITDTVPLIVNTMGWSRGLGADLMQQIEEMVEPSEIFEFQSDDESGLSHGKQKRDAFSDTSDADGTERIQRMLEPAPSSSTSFTPADHRTISILSYFHANFPSIQRINNNQNINHHSSIQSWDISLPLCSIPPYEIDVGVALDQILLTGPGSEDVVSEEVGRVLNGALVGFVQLDHHLHQRKEDNFAGIPYIQARPPPSPSESSCVGLGLIRGISTTSVSTSKSNVILHVLTPIPPPLLANARILVKGEMELPIWGMLDLRDMDEGVAGVERGRVPYLQWGRVPEGVVGGDRRRVRRNLMRRGQA